MPVYTVHAPPEGRKRGSAPEDYVFVRDGFYVWALVFGPAWILFRRLWLVLLLYVVLMALIGTAIWAAGLRDAMGSWPMLLVSILLGLEAGTLWRWTLSRRGWGNAGLVVADNVEEAERRFFDRLAASSESPAREVSPPPAPSSVLPRTVAPQSVIGLFPEPGASR